MNDFSEDKAALARAKVAQALMERQDSSFLPLLATVLGTAAGAYFGGPAGAGAGASLGNTLGTTLGGTGGATTSNSSSNTLASTIGAGANLYGALQTKPSQQANPNTVDSTQTKNALLSLLSMNRG